MASDLSFREFSDEVSKLLNIDLESRYRDQVGDYSLRNVLPKILESAKDKYNKTIKIASDIPDETLKEITINVMGVRSFLNTIYGFSDQDFIDKRADIIGQIKTLQDDLLIIWQKIAPIYIDKSYSSENIENLNQSFKSNQEQREQYLQDLQTLRIKSDQDANTIDQLRQRLESELKNFDARYKDLFAKGEILKQEEVFLKTADYNENQSRYWLIGIGLIICLFIWVLYCFISACWIDFNCIMSGSAFMTSNKQYVTILFYYELIKKSVLRVFLLSLIGYAVKFSVKNYNALKHNFILNRHKANSLAAALNLMERLPAGSGKDSVISTASKEIFEQHKTGYMDKNEEILNIGLLEKVLNVLKGSSGEKK